MEQAPLFNTINFVAPGKLSTYSSALNLTVALTPVKSFLCPSDPTPVNVPDDKNPPNNFGVSCYGYVCGDWYVSSLSSATTVGPQNRSAFSPNYSRTLAAFTDGLSNTMLSAESQVGRLQFRDCQAASATNSSFGGMTPTSVPLDYASSKGFIASTGPSCRKRGRLGLTRWANGGVYYSGVTTALTPNTKINVSPQTLTVAPYTGQTATGPWDLVSVDDNNGGPTYAALTASSYHPGGANVLFGDGSVRFVKDSVNWQTYRALGTVSGGEVISADAY